MAVTQVSQREIVEVPYTMPNGEIKTHPALVLSTQRLSDAEDGMFYAVLISTKNHHPQYTMEVKEEWLNKPMGRNSFFVTHIVSFFKLDQVIQSSNTFIKKEYFNNILSKVIDSMFDLPIEFE